MAKLTKPYLLARLAESEAELARLRARETPRVMGPGTAVSRIREACQREQECFVVLILDARQHVLSVHEVARGSLAEVTVHPREVFREAVRMAAHSIIVGHNHPSGDPDPSDADIMLTRRLCDAGVILGIPVLDHLIVTSDSHMSLRDIGVVLTAGERD